VLFRSDTESMAWSPTEHMIERQVVPDHSGFDDLNGDHGGG